MASPETFYPSLDGIVRNAATGSNQAAWTALIAAGTGTVVDYTTASQVAVQCDNGSYGDSKQYCDRQFYAFDTSALPDGAVILDVKLRVYVEGPATSTDGGSVNVYESTVSSTSVLATSDFGLVNTTAWATAINFSAIATGAYNEWTFNAAGLAAINKTGYTKLCLRGSRDATGVVPTSWQRSSLELIRNSEYAGTGSDPHLIVTYGDPVAATEAVTVTDGTGTVTVSVPVTASDTVGFSDSAVVAVPVTTASVVYADDFTGTAATTLAGRASTGAGSDGSVWARDPAMSASTIVISDANRARALADPGYSDGFYTIGSAMASADYDVEADGAHIAGTSSSGSSNIGVLGRWTAGSGSPAYNSRGYNAFYDHTSGDVSLARYVPVAEGGGAIVGTPYALGVGQSPRIMLSMRGDVITVYVDGVARIVYTDSSPITGPGHSGIRVRYGYTDAGNDRGIHLDNFRAGVLRSPTVTDSITVSDGGASVTDPSQVSVAASDAVTVSDVAATLRQIGPSAASVSQASGTPQTVSGFTDGGDGLDYNAFPGLCVAPNGNLILAYHHADGHVGTGTNKVDVKIGVPNGDGTYTWGSRATVRTTTGNSGATPGNVADVGLVTLANGQLLLTWNESTTPGHAYITTLVRFQCLWSSDNGATWGQKATPTDGVITTTAVPGWATMVTAGSPGGAYAVAPCKPIQLTNGDLLLATYGWDDRAIEDGGGSFSSREYVKCMKSTDNGSSWTQIGTVFPDTVGIAYDETELLLLDNGTILAAARTITGSGTGYNITTRTSTDSGVTWSASTTALGTSSGTGYGGRPSMVQTANGGVLMRLRKMLSGASSGPSYVLSTDRGATWTGETDPYTAGAPSASAPVSPRGMDIYGEFARVSANEVAYVWCEEVNGSDSCVIYFRLLTVVGGLASETITASDSAAVVGTSSTAKSASDAFSVTDTAGVPYVFSSAAATDAVSVADAASLTSVETATASDAIVFTEPLVQAFEVEGSSFTIHPQGMVPGTAIGAYLRWEWKGPVAAKLNAGPGAAVKETTIADDLTATFAGLDPGEYVAYSSDYPTRRLFFMVTE